MSTKTTIKRVALVVTTSIGLSFLANIPAQAAMAAPTVAVTNGTSLKGNMDSSTDYASFTVTGTITSTAVDSVAVTVVAKTVPAGASVPTASMFVLETSSTYAVQTKIDTNAVGIATASGIGQNGVSLLGGIGNNFSTTDSVVSGGSGTLRIFGAAGAFYTKMGLLMDSSTSKLAGTYTYTVSVTYPSSSAVNTVASYDVSFTVSATAAASLTASQQYSTAYIQQTPSGTVSTAVASDSVVAIPAYAQADTTDSASVVVILRNASNSTAARESITATTTLGLLRNGTVTGKSVVFPYTTTSLAIGIKGDGVAGVGTITISSPSVTFATKTFSLYSTSVSTITGTKRLNTLAVGTNSAAVTAVVKDSSGNQNGLDTAVYAYSSDTTIVSTYGSACAYSVANARQECTLTGVAPGTVTITLRNAATVATSTVSDAATYSVTVSTGTPTTLQLSLDKTSYAPGEKGYLFISANDSTGKPVAPQTITNLIAATGLVTNAQLGASSDTLTGYTTANGVSLALAQKSALTGRLSLEPVFQFVFYAPTVGSSLTFTAVGGAGLPVAGQVAVTATAKIANEANDNASAALAAVTALASQVSAFITKINAQITTLTDLVMKIQKKVKA